MAVHVFPRWVRVIYENWAWRYIRGLLPSLSVWGQWLSWYDRIPFTLGEKKPHSTVFEGRKPFLLLLNGAWEVRPTRLSLLWEVDSVGVTSHLKRVNRLSVERCWHGYRFHSRPKSRMNHSHGPVTTSSLLLLSPSNLLKNKITL